MSKIGRLRLDIKDIKDENEDLKLRLKCLEDKLGLSWDDICDCYLVNGSGELGDIKDSLINVSDDQCLYALLEYLNVVYEAGPRIVKKSPKKKK